MEKKRNLLNEEIVNITSFIEQGYNNKPYHPAVSIGVLRSWLQELQKYRAEYQGAILKDADHPDNVYDDEYNHSDGDETIGQDYEDDEECCENDDYEDEYFCVSAERDILNSIYHGSELTTEATQALIEMSENEEIKEYFHNVVKEYKELLKFTKHV